MFPSSHIVYLSLSPQSLCRTASTAYAHSSVPPLPTRSLSLTPAFSVPSSTTGTSSTSWLGTPRFISGWSGVFFLWCMFRCFWVSDQIVRGKTIIGPSELSRTVQFLHASPCMSILSCCPNHTRMVGSILGRISSVLGVTSVFLEVSGLFIL